MMRIIILCKVPVPGHVKTRLHTSYTPKEAAKLHEKMIESVVKKALAVSDDVWLATDDPRHSFFDLYKTNQKLEVCNQSKGSLGDRLKHLHRLSIDKDNKSVLFLGTDSPHVHMRRYQQAKEYLETHDIVLGPVEDGGYDLIALNQPAPSLFDNISWGTHTVFEETLNHINKLSLSLKVLETSFDLDRPEDIQRAPPHTW